MDRKPLNEYISNSVEQNGMQQNVAIHQGQHCLLRQNHSSEKEKQCFVERYDLGATNLYKWFMYHDFIVYSFKEKFTDLKRVDPQSYQSNIYTIFNFNYKVRIITLDVLQIIQYI